MLVRNWNEDRFGEEKLSRTGIEVAKQTVKSETKERFVAPAKMDDRQVRSFPAGTPGSYTQSRDGMVGRLLFAHGIDAHDPTAGTEGHYATMYVSICGPP